MASSSFNRRPIVGIMVPRPLIITTGMVELAKANKEAQTALYFFTTRDVDFKHKTIEGTYYNYDNKGWGKKSFPMPDVLYVRGGSTSNVQRAVKLFDKMGVKRMNPVVRFDKGELFGKLIKDVNLRPYLPYTKTIRDLDQVREYVRRMGSVYIKACFGWRGTKVMRVEKRPKGGYAYSYAIITDLVRKKVKHFENLRRAMKQFFRDREVIVQEAIGVVRMGDNRHVDFRAELQRNGKGELEITAIAVRIGKKNSPITTHANAYRMEDKLKDLFPAYTDREIDDLKKHIEQFVAMVYRSVEQCYGKFGEMGIDFAVDKNGKIWLIECNAQSTKVSIRKAFGSSTIRKIYLNPLEYAKKMWQEGTKKGG